MPDACLRRVRQALPRAPAGQRARGPVAALHGLASDVPSAPHGLANPGLRLQPTAAGEARARASRQPRDDRKPARESNHDAPTEPVRSQISSPSTNFLAAAFHSRPAPAQLLGITTAAIDDTDVQRFLFCLAGAAMPRPVSAELAPARVTPRGNGWHICYATAHPSCANQRESRLERLASDPTRSPKNSTAQLSLC